MSGTTRTREGYRRYCRAERAIAVLSSETLGDNDPPSIEEVLPAIFIDEDPWGDTPYRRKGDPEELWF